MKTIQDIIENVKAGKKVYWKNPAYQVKIFSNGAFIVCLNGHMVGLTKADGTTSYDVNDFYVGEK